MSDRTLTISKHEIVIDRDYLIDLKQKFVMALETLQKYSDNSLVISENDHNWTYGNCHAYDIAEVLEELTFDSAASPDNDCGDN